MVKESKKFEVEVLWLVEVAGVACIATTSPWNGWADGGAHSDSEPGCGPAPVQDESQGLQGKAGP